MTVQQEHSQCPLVEMDSTTSLSIFLCEMMNGASLTFEWMGKDCAQPLANRKIHLLILGRPLVVLPLMLQKVSTNVFFNLIQIKLFCQSNIQSYYGGGLIFRYHSFQVMRLRLCMTPALTRLHCLRVQLTTTTVSPDSGFKNSAHRICKVNHIDIYCC